MVSSSLLPAFIAANSNLATLLADPRFTTDEVMTFLTDPETQAKLAEIAKVAHLGLTIRAAEARHAALNILEEVAKKSEDLVEKRRAASALFRATASPLIPLNSTSRAGPSDPDADSSRKNTPPRPRLTSHPDLHPRAVAIAAMRALVTNDTPERDSGVATLDELSEKTITIDSSPTPTDDIETLAAALKPTCLGAVRNCRLLRPWRENDSFGNNDRQHTVRFTCSHARGFTRIDVHLRPSPITHPLIEPPPPDDDGKQRSREQWLIHAVTSTSGP